MNLICKGITQNKFSNIEAPYKSEISQYFTEHSTAVAYSSSTVIDVTNNCKTDIPNAMFTDGSFD